MKYHGLARPGGSTFAAGSIVSHSEIPPAKVRGYADDVALVTEDLLRDVPALQDFVASRVRPALQLHQDSNHSLGLHHPGTITQPIPRDQPFLSCSTMRFHAAYLGIPTGYGRGGNSWQKPLAKAQSRAAV